MLIQEGKNIYNVIITELLSKSVAMLWTSKTGSSVTVTILTSNILYAQAVLFVWCRELCTLNVAIDTKEDSE